jgi:hypothetical protein
MLRAELHRRLTEWADAYGGGKYESLGYPKRNTLATVIEMGGYVPNASGRIQSTERTPADRVQAVVQAMPYALAQVLRCDYFMPNLAMPSRLDRLRAVGIRVSKNTYYPMLSEAEEWVNLQLD